MKKNLFLLLLVTILSGCNDVDLIQSDYTIYSGSSFGMCVGDECIQELSMNEYQAVLKTGSWAQEGKRELSVKEIRGVDADDWNAVVSLVDEGVIHSMPDVIGCPDCADGGAEWIEVRNTNISKKITFEYGKSPQAIKELTDRLRLIREELGSGQ